MSIWSQLLSPRTSSFLNRSRPASSSGACVATGSSTSGRNGTGSRGTSTGAIAAGADTRRGRRGRQTRGSGRTSGAAGRLKFLRMIGFPWGRAVCHAIHVTDAPPRSWWPAAGLTRSAAVSCCRRREHRYAWAPEALGKGRRFRHALCHYTLSASPSVVSASTDIPVCPLKIGFLTRCGLPATVVFHIGSEIIVLRCQTHAEAFRLALRSLLRPTQWTEKDLLLEETLSTSID
jgi:hypothetical protein